jgi:drug/metabolite transporter (DMT)-like permease
MPLWLTYSLFATLFYGMLNFLYKVAAEKKYLNQAVILISASTVVVSAAVTIIVSTKISGNDFPNIIPAIPYALVNGTLFAIGALAKFKALTLAPASVVFPVNKSNVLFVIIIGILFFNESPTISQWAGIGTSLLVLILISSEQFKISGSHTLKGIFFAVFAALCTSFSMTAGKLASVSVDRNSYILLSYSIVALISLIGYLRLTNKEVKSRTFSRPGIFVIGGIIGVLNFAGYGLVLKAFAAGSMSLIQPIFTLSILIPIFLSAAIYKEKLTVIRILSIGLSLAAVLLIKNG